MIVLFQSFFTKLLSTLFLFCTCTPAQIIVIIWIRFWAFYLDRVKPQESFPFFISFSIFPRRSVILRILWFNSSSLKVCSNSTIFSCCKMHDWCYTTTSCMFFQYNLPYFVPYKWKCNGGAPYCGKYITLLPVLALQGWVVVEGSDFILPVGDRKGGDSCSHQLCECDRKFVSCLSRYNCPHSKAMCKSPWRYFQNLFMGLGTGMVNFPSVEKRSELLYCLKLIPVFHVIYHWP